MNYPANFSWFFESFPVWREDSPMCSWLMALKGSCQSAMTKADCLCTATVPCQAHYTSTKTSLISESGDNYTPPNSFKGHQSPDWRSQDFTSTWPWSKQPKKQTKLCHDCLWLLSQLEIKNVWHVNLPSPYHFKLHSSLRLWSMWWKQTEYKI